MKGFKQCPKDHFYKEDKDSCPYCPTNNPTDVLKTEHLSNPSDKTNVDNSKTQVFGGAPSNSKSNSDPKTQSFDATKTMIVGGDKTNSEGNAADVLRRRLRGWLVTFDIEDFGVDFKILEGRNLIGSLATNDITIKDSQVSSSHGLILCKKNKFIITDEMSSNGTSINGEDLSPRDPYELKDGDEIKIGHTSLLFKTAFKQ
tara:strand:- start:2608 stop:3210 length:603 start_codon:yes stop_codon:yes gene_type:complete